MDTRRWTIRVLSHFRWLYSAVLTGEDAALEEAEACPSEHRPLEHFRLYVESDLSSAPELVQGYRHVRRRCGGPPRGHGPGRSAGVRARAREVGPPARVPFDGLPGRVPAGLPVMTRKPRRG